MNGKTLNAKGAKEEAQGAQGRSSLRPYSKVNQDA
jgi:hypothetical protein